MMNDQNKLPGDDDDKRVSRGRLLIWVVVGAIGLYLVVTGLWGVFTK
ncbi:hypothetical protein WDJ51_04115 [Rathayibacter sp. YIM 133350]